MSEHALSRRDQALAVAVADDALDPRRRARAEARLARTGGCDALLERQRRVARALRDGPAAPPGLAPVGRTSTRRVRRRARLALVAAGPVAAAVAIALVVSLPGHSPAVSQAAEQASLPAQRPARPLRTGGPLLAASFEGLAFPDWSGEFGWRPTGVRDGRVGDRETRTVFYEHQGHRIGYTIVSGEALARPAGAERVQVAGVDIALVEDGVRTIAVFERDGRTCVLAGHVLHRSTLVELAAWQGGGAVDF